MATMRSLTPRQLVSSTAVFSGPLKNGKLSVVTVEDHADSSQGQLCSLVHWGTEGVHSWQYRQKCSKDILSALPTGE